MKQDIEEQLELFKQEEDPEYGENYVKITNEEDKAAEDLATFNFRENL